LWDVGSRLLDDVAVFRQAGMAGVRTIHAAAADPDTTSLSTLTARSLLHPFTVRHGTTDVREFIATICRGAYDAQLPPDARWILDLGANIGDTAAWFLSRYPNATAVAVEPDPGNVALAARNLAPYGQRARLIQAAVWTADGDVSFHVSANWPSGSRVVQTQEAIRVRAVSIPTLLREHGIDTIDVLKCDIEGAETQIFLADPDPWLSRTRVLAIELHDVAARAAVVAAAARCGFRPREFREVTVFSR
jgi:FkbM family methyltransferase